MKSGNLLELSDEGWRQYANGIISFQGPILLLKKTYDDDADGSSWEILVSRNGEVKNETWIILPSVWKVIA